MSRDEGKTREELIAELRILREQLATKQAGEERQEASNGSVELETIFDAFPSPVSFLDRNLAYLAVNAAYERCHGVKKKGLTGTSPAEHLPIETYAEMKPHLDRCLNGEDVVLDMWLDFPGRGRRYMNVGYHPKRDEQGNVVGIVHISRDITVRVEAEKERTAELRQTNALLAREIEERKRDAIFLDSLVDNIPNMVFVKDARELRFVRFNRAGEELLGLSSDQLLGKNDYDLFPEYQADFFTTKDRQTLASGKLVDIPEEEIETQVLGKRVLHTKKVPLFDTRGEPLYLLGISEDITERIAAQKEIETTYRRLDSTLKLLTTVMSAIPIPLFYKDKEGRYLGVNDAFANLMGYTPEFYKGKTVMELWPGEFAAVYHERDLELMRHPQTQIYEFKVLDKNGVAHPAIWSKQVFRDEDGQVAGIVGAFQDITERVAAEEAVRKAEEEKSLILNSTSDLVVYHAPDLRILWSNKTAAVSVNDTVENLKGRMCYEIWNQRSEPCVGCPVLLARESGQAEEAMIASPDGRRWYVRGSPVKNAEGEVVALVEFRLDVTKLKQAEEALQAEKNRLKHILRGTNAGTWEWNVQTGETTFNERWAEMVGYSLEELLPTTIDTWSNLCHPDDLNVSSALLDRHFSGDLEYYECEARMRHRNGDWIWVLDRGKVSSWTDDGKPLVMSGTHQDISQRKRAEKALEDLNRTLEELVDERTTELQFRSQELEVAYIRLKDLDALKSSLMDTVSHDLRTPLTSILGFAKIILRDFTRFFQEPTRSKDDLAVRRASRIQDNLSIIIAEGERLTRLINDFLDLSKIESGRLQWRDREVAVEEVVNRAVNAVRGEFMAKKNIALTMDVAPNLPLLRIDPDRLEQVLVNLLNNAAKFTERGSVTFKAVLSEQGTLHFVVKDTGVGIPEHELKRIFDKFHKVEPSNHGARERPGGTGLGLSICKEIVQHYGGRIWAESRLGEGTALHIELPEALFITT